MKNKNLILFIIIGFIVTCLLWGFVGGCGTTNVPMKTEPMDIAEDASAFGVISDKTTLSAKGGSYIVEPGDTLWKIGKKFRISVSYIKELNKLKTDSISVGQRLVIPEAQIQETTESVKKNVWEASPSVKGEEQGLAKQETTPNLGTTVYKVRKDDSLWRIAQIYGTTIEHIAELNGISKNAKLTPGQEILVPRNE